MPTTWLHASAPSSDGTNKTPRLPFSFPEATYGRSRSRTSFIFPDGPYQ